MHQFLMGLNEARFSNVCTNISGMEVFPDLNSVYQRVVREMERLGASRLDSKEAPVGFSATSVQRDGEDATMGGVMAAVARSRGSVVCRNCGRAGHEKECWQLIRFPEWFTERNQSSGSGGRGRGRLKSNSTRANVVHVQGGSTGSSSANQGNSMPQFTIEQWASLTSLLERQNPSPTPDRLNGTVQTGEVIIDTRYHFTGRGMFYYWLMYVVSFLSCELCRR